MIDFTMTNLMLLIFVGIPLAVAFTGIIIGAVYVMYVLTKDIFSSMQHMHHKGAH